MLVVKLQRQARGAAALQKLARGAPAAPPRGSVLKARMQGAVAGRVVDREDRATARRRTATAGLVGRQGSRYAACRPSEVHPRPPLSVPCFEVGYTRRRAASHVGIAEGATQGGRRFGAGRTGVRRALVRAVPLRPRPTPRPLSCHRTCASPAGTPQRRSARRSVASARRAVACQRSGQKPCRRARLTATPYTGAYEKQGEGDLLA